MSLNAVEIRPTRGELRANLELSELSAAAVAADLGWSADRVALTAGVALGNDPVDVWELRDYLERTLVEAGRRPVRFTVLTEGARAMAGRWYQLRQAPSHGSAATSPPRAPAAP